MLDKLTNVLQTLHDITGAEWRIELYRTSQEMGWYDLYCPDSFSKWWMVEISVSNDNLQVLDSDYTKMLNKKLANAETSTT